LSDPIVVTIPHGLGSAEARRRIDHGADGLMGQLAGVGRMTKAWTGDAMSFAVDALGQQITGRIEVADAEVRVEIRLPGVLGLLAAKVRGRVQKEGQLLLGGPGR
jgi:hypothetical protein